MKCVKNILHVSKTLAKTEKHKNNVLFHVRLVLSKKRLYFLHLVCIKLIDVNMLDIYKCDNNSE